MRKTVLIIGAGPAGLTAAYELLEQSDAYDVVVFEESGVLGGISRTVCHNGNRMDMGGHRFFSKVPEVNDFGKRANRTTHEKVSGQQSTGMGS